MTERQTWLERNFGLVVVSIIVLALVGVPVLWQFWIAPTVVEQNVESGQDIAEDSLDSDKALQDYREFRTLWHEIQAQHEQTQNYKSEEEQFHETYGDDPQEWSRTAETQHGRIHQRITGSENQEANLIAEYNSMQDDATTAIFQCGLPNRVDEKLFITDGAGVDYTSDEARNRTPPEDPTECQFSGDPDPDS